MVISEFTKDKIIGGYKRASELKKSVDYYVDNIAFSSSDYIHVLNAAKEVICRLRLNPRTMKIATRILKNKESKARIMRNLNLAVDQTEYEDAVIPSPPLVYVALLYEFGDTVNIEGDTWGEDTSAVKSEEIEEPEDEVEV